MFHINPETGNPGKCRAKTQCPYGDFDTEHYVSEEAAYFTLAKKYGTAAFKSYSRKNTAAASKISGLELSTGLSKKQRKEIETNWKKLPASQLEYLQKYEPAIYHELAKAKARKSQKLQPGLLYECTASQQIAKNRGLDEFIVVTNNDSIPEAIRNTVEQNSITPRYIYTNGKEFLVQAGDPNNVDAVLIGLEDEINIEYIEYKEETARFGQVTLDFDQEGNILISPSVREKYPEKKALFDYVEGKNVYELEGHNFTDFPDALVTDAFLSSYTSQHKKADLFVVESQDGKIKASSKEDLLASVKISASLQTAGNSANLVIDNDERVIRRAELMGGTYGSKDASVLLPKNEVLKILHSNGKGNTRIKFPKEDGTPGSLFYVKFEDLEDEGDNYYCALESVKELRPRLGLVSQS